MNPSLWGWGHSSQEQKLAGHLPGLRGRESWGRELTGHLKWDKKKLDRVNIIYAAIDVFVALQLYRVLKPMSNAIKNSKKTRKGGDGSSSCTKSSDGSSSCSESSDESPRANKRRRRLPLVHVGLLGSWPPKVGPSGTFRNLLELFRYPAEKFPNFSGTLETTFLI